MDKTTQKKVPAQRDMHGSYDNKQIVAVQGMNTFKQNPANFEVGNPLTSTGKKVMGSMSKSYGKKKAKQVFYASVNKGKPGSGAWHK